MTHAPDHRAGHTAVVGLQWGDEGKGKVTDLLTREHDVIVRYNGGANAGHTIVVGEERYALHLVPSGILSADRICVIGNGVVVDPVKLLEEIRTLRTRGVEVGANLRLSDRAHVVMPYHKALDGALEESVRTGTTSGEAIGTTRRGIGPAYAGKVFRSLAIRVGDLLHPTRLRTKLETIVPIQNAILTALGAPADGASAADLADEYAALGAELAPHITDTTYFLHDCIKDGRSILLEGANACLLDVDHGTYPFVTSSNCSTLGIPAGTGVPFKFDRVVGIMKAYATRVGSGPMPTELHDAIGDLIRDRGHEYGTTTGRPRRCGWLDLVAVRYSAMLCGVTSIACMLLDVLSGFDEVGICTAYRLPDGSLTDRFIPDADDLAEIEPVYEMMEGWSAEIDGLTDRRELPAAAQAYITRIESFLDLPLDIVSVGPAHAQTMIEA